ncbi:M24 family metallopeptidase [Enterocloster lavalensis]|uniref:M24 family metallopeptidase n=1 Tax=Enterocloster lavalensis TaxID=460384 RepID=UPI0023F44926|nr:Xaa-Pro peptidase family protein [Enterocloster lavalensis]
MRKRIQQVKAAMAAHGIHTLLTFDPKNVNYLTGFHTTARPIWQIGRTACLLSADGTWRLFLPAPWDREYAPPPGCETVSYTGGDEGLARALCGHLPTDSRKRTAADLDAVPAPLYRALNRCGRGDQLTDARLLLARCRMIKSPAEIELLEQAVRLIDLGLTAAGEAVAVGAAEQEVQARIDAAMALAGSQGCGFTTKVISGPNGSYPHHVAGPRELAAGSAVIVDLSASVSGYESDSARTFLLPPGGGGAEEGGGEIRAAYGGRREMNGEARAAYAGRQEINGEARAAYAGRQEINGGARAAYAGRQEINGEARAAYHELLEMHHGITELLLSAGKRMKPGTPIRELHDFLRAELTRLNPAAVQAGTIGHGVGLRAHEYPDLTGDCPELLAENMVLAVEPALYVPGRYGIRIENMFHIGPEGATAMNRYPLNRYDREGDDDGNL